MTTLAELQAQLAPGQIAARVGRPWLAQAADAVLAAAQTAAPVAPARPDAGRPPGTLRDSLQREVAPDGQTARVWTDDPVGAFVHGGTAPHVISAAPGHVLAWPAADGGTAFAQRVQHPGTAPNPFLERAAEAALPAVAAAGAAIGLRFWTEVR